MSQQKLGAAIGVTRQHVQKCEMGTRRLSASQLHQITSVLKIPPAFFFDDYDQAAAGLLQEQVEVLALIRDSGITAVQLRAIAALPDDARQAVVSLIEATARAESRRRGPAEAADS